MARRTGNRRFARSRRDFPDLKIDAHRQKIHADE
jgi:hypothetical protein